MRKRGFCEIKFRSMLLSGTFTMAIIYVMLLCDSIIAGLFIGENGVAAINAITPVTGITTFFANIIKQNSSEKKKRYVGGCCSFNDYYLSLDEAFDVAIKHHPEWLDEYPQLSAQYYRVGDKVFKIKDSVYDENKDISAHQLKQRRL